MFDFGCLIVFVSHLKASQQQVTEIDILNVCAGTLPPNDLCFFLFFYGIMHCFLCILTFHNTAFDFWAKFPQKQNLKKKKKQTRERDPNIR